MSIETKHSPGGLIKSTGNEAEHLRRDVVIQSLQLELCVQRYRRHVCKASTNIPENASFEQAEAEYHRAIEQSEEGRRLAGLRDLVRNVRAQFQPASLAPQAATASEVGL
jgi:hypothetical protein